MSEGTIEQQTEPMSVVTRDFALPDSWKVVVTVALIVVEAIGFIVLFSDIFYGVDVFNSLSTNSSTAYMIGGMSLCLFLVMYILDFSYWKGTQQAQWQAWQAQWRVV